MQPAIPKQFSLVDATLIADHYRLKPDDNCLYIWEYARRGGYAHSPANSLILNFKRDLPDVADDPRKAAHKQAAIAYCAVALRSLMQSEWLDHEATLVPVPPSKAARHPDHDNRLMKTLSLASVGYNADIRPLIRQTRSTSADHESGRRLSLEHLRSITRIDDRLASRSVRSTLIVFDDVLNSGKHFKIAQELLHRRFPHATILGVFLARCLPVRMDPERELVAPWS